MNIGYMGGPEPRYAWTDYVTRQDLTEGPDDNVSQIIQVNMANRRQVFNVFDYNINNRV